MKAVIPAAGAGTRFLPLTKNAPKEMLPLLDKPAIQYVVEEAVESGCEDILVITGRGKRVIEDHFDRSPELEDLLRARGETDMLERLERIADLATIHYVRQKRPLGLGDAVRCARRHVGEEPFALLLGDDIVFSEVPCTRQLIDTHEETGGSIAAVEPVPRSRLSAYGVVDVGVNGHHGGRRRSDRLLPVIDLVEKPRPEEAPSRLGILGRYVLDPGIFDAIDATSPDARGEVQLTDALRRLGKRVPLYAYRFEGRRFDLGNPLDWLMTNVEVALMDPRLAPALSSQLAALVRGPGLVRDLEAEVAG